MTIPEMQRRYAATLERLTHARRIAAKLQEQADLEAAWLREHGVIVPARAAPLATAIRNILVRPMKVAEIAEKVVAAGYTPASPGSRFHKTIRRTLVNKPEWFEYEGFRTAKWKRAT
jgi:hypothetical protein